MMMMVIIIANLCREILSRWGNGGGETIEELVLNCLGNKIIMIMIIIIMIMIGMIMFIIITFASLTHNDRRNRLTADEGAVELELILLF